MRSRATAALGFLLGTLLASSCTVDRGTHVTSEAGAAPLPAVALVETGHGLAGVAVGSGNTLWTVQGAVAAPDGSAAFVLRPAGKGTSAVLEVDTHTGELQQVATMPSAPDEPHVAAVAPQGHRLVLAGPAPGYRTKVSVVDPGSGLVVREQSFEGTVEPEAFSVDGSFLYAARVLGDFYRVHALDLANGQQYPTVGPDKTAPPEDMRGAIVQAALSPDGRQLATLYRDSASAEHTAFVHLLSLENGSTVCIDLHAPFGSPLSEAVEAIEWRSDGAVVAVGHTPRSEERAVEASFRPADIWSGEPQPHYHADALPSAAPPQPPSGVADAPGFRRFVALATTR